MTLLEYFRQSKPFYRSSTK